MRVLEEIKRHYLYPSTLFVDSDKYQVSTLLGSCVAVCLYDTKLKIGGINHYMLPFWSGRGLASPKFGNVAISKLIDNIESLGSQRKNLIAKVFGGGNPLLNESDNAGFNIGNRNIQIAYEMLEEYKISIIAKSVGGKKGRKIQFDTFTGVVLMKVIG